MHNQVAEQIKEVIKLRLQQLPLLQVKIQNARDVQEGLRALESALSKLEEHPNVTSSLREHIHEFKKLPLYAEITSSLQELETVKAAYYVRP